MSSFRRLWLSRLALLCLGLLGLYLSGPQQRVSFRSSTTQVPREDIEKYLQHSEAAYPAIIPGTEKSVVWAGRPGDRTPVSIVYIHGFSASRQDTYPLCARLAAKLGANVFYTRLTGHGLGADALASVRIEQLLQDTIEALEVGRRLGEKVIIIGNSSGGALAGWLATLENNNDVLAYILLSPALGFRHPLSSLLAGPWGAEIARLVVGPQFGNLSPNPLVNRYWTRQYPSRALVIPGLLADYVKKASWENVHRPVLLLFCAEDLLVNPAPALKAVGRIPSRQLKAAVPVRGHDHPEQHVLAGDLRAPAGTDEVAGIILAFINQIKR